MKTLKRTLQVLSVASVISFSGMVGAQESLSNAEMRKIVEDLKLEMAQHVGVQAYYDEKKKMVTLSGFTDNPSYVANLIKKLESFEHVKEVRSSISISND